MVVASPVLAQPHGEITELRVERAENGLVLSGGWRMELPALVENALYQGIAVHFSIEAQVVRPRWYWADKTVARTVRHLRLSYQPLTRRWRLVQSAGMPEAAGLGVALGQNFDELADALAALQRIARWQIADAALLDDNASYVVDFQVRLDTSQLPRPLQIGAVGRSSWNLSLSRRIVVPPVEAPP